MSPEGALFASEVVIADGCLANIGNSGSANQLKTNKKSGGSGDENRGSG